jgi:hypothetical protein
MLYFSSLFGVAEEYGRDPLSLKVGQIRQLPINSAVSPTDPEYHPVGGLLLFIRQLDRRGRISLLDCPDDIRIISLQPPFQEGPDVLLSADTKMDSLAADLVKTGSKRRLLYRFLIPDRTKTLVNLSLRQR